jgi:hypothetical protein
MSTTITLRLFGLFTTGDWIYTALVNDERTHFVPVMLLPTQRFYLDVIAHPDSTVSSCGPYSMLLDFCRSLGVEIQGLAITTNPAPSGKVTVYGAVRLKMQNDIGTQVGIIQCDVPDLVVLHALTDIPIFGEEKVLSPIAVPLSESGMEDVRMLKEIESRMNTLRQETEALQSLMKELKDMPPETTA